MLTGPRQIAVLVTAENDGEGLSRCLAGLDTARQWVEMCQINPPIIRIVVVLDRYADRSAIAESWPGIEVVAAAANTGRVRTGRVSLARTTGAAFVLRDADPAAVWIAWTDADSVVPTQWLVTQLRAAQSGADLLLGAVRPDPAELTALEMQRWLAVHDWATGHRCIHAANLGIRGDVYARVGGFPNTAPTEVVVLVDLVRASGGLIVGSVSDPVLTGARTPSPAPAPAARSNWAQPGQRLISTGGPGIAADLAPGAGLTVLGNLS